MAKHFWLQKSLKDNTADDLESAFIVARNRFGSIKRAKTIAMMVMERQHQSGRSDIEQVIKCLRINSYANSDLSKQYDNLITTAISSPEERKLRLMLRKL